MVNPAPVRVPKKSNLSSPLVKAANKITTSPTFNKARTIDFDKKAEYKRFIKFIESSNQELLKIKLPNAGDVKKSGGGDDSSGGGGGDGLLQKGLKFLLANVIGATLVKILKSLYKKLIPKKLRLRLKKLRIRIIKPFYKFNKWIKNTRANIKNFFKQSIDDILASVKKNIDELAKSLKNSFDDLIKYLTKLRKFKFKNIKPVKPKINPKNILNQSDELITKPKPKFNFKNFFKNFNPKNIGIGIIIGFVTDALYGGMYEMDARMWKSIIEGKGTEQERLKLAEEYLSKVAKAQNWKENNPNLYKLQQAWTFVSGFISGEFKTETDVTIDTGLRVIELLQKGDKFEEGELEELLKNLRVNNNSFQEGVEGVVVTDQKEIKEYLKAYPHFEKYLETNDLIRLPNNSYKFKPKEINKVEAEPKINLENLFNSDIGSLTDFNYADLMKENPNLNTIPFIMKQGDNNIFLSQPNNGELLNSSNVNFKMSTSMIDFDIGKMDSIMFDELYNFKLDNGN